MHLRNRKGASGFQGVDGGTSDGPRGKNHWKDTALGLVSKHEPSNKKAIVEVGLSGRIANIEDPLSSENDLIHISYLSLKEKGSPSAKGSSSLSAYGDS